MLRQKRLFALAAAALLLCVLSLTAYAHPVPDLARKGSISIAMRYEDAAVPGGAITLYRVGAVQEQNGDYTFVLTGDFKDCGIALEDLQSASLAEALAEYAAGNKLKGTVQAIGTDGKIRFADLEPGLYLLVQTQAASGYYAANPFLVSVPALEKEEYVYDVNASPKVELSPAPTPTPTPTPTPWVPVTPPDGPDPTPTPGVTPTPTPGTTPTPTPTPTTPGVTPPPVVPPPPGSTPLIPLGDDGVPTTGRKPGTTGIGDDGVPTSAMLPQTGQLNWPVPVLASAGLGLFSLGWMLRYGKKDEDEK